MVMKNISKRFYRAKKYKIEKALKRKIKSDYVKKSALEVKKNMKTNQTCH